MMKHFERLIALAGIGALAACSGTQANKPEKGPQGTIAYYIQVESSEPGARVEVDGDYIGNTPMKVRVFGDKDGTFHNFGQDDYMVRVFPVSKGQFVQTKVFKTGRWFSQEDRIPGRLYFDLSQKSEGFTIDLPAPTKSE